jgi:hypothetical protein
MAAEAYGYGGSMAEATRELVATYRDASSARAAIAALERTGVDAERIRLLAAPGARTPKTGAAMREPDMALTGDVGMRGVTVAIAAAFVLGGIAAIVGWAVSGPTAALIAGVGFAVAGGTLGFFYGGASVLSVSEEWSDTYETTGPTTISVHVPDGAVIDLRDRIEATNPRTIQIT